MENLRALFRLCLFFFVLISFFCFSIIIYPLYFVAPFFTTKFLSEIVSWHSWIFLKLIGVKVLSRGDKPEPGTLLVSNHLGYLDVLVMASLHPSCFVTSVEIKETPFLGHICRMAGCLFVERRNRSKLPQEISSLAQYLREGLTICLFPEGTSSDGSTVLRFRRPFFKTPILANTTISPACINYLKLGERALTLENRDCLFWYGDMPFFSHFWNLLKIPQIRCEVSFLSPIQIETSVDEIELAEGAHRVIQGHFVPITK